MALRDVVSYLITAQDQTRAATQSAQRNLQGLQQAYAGVQRTMRTLSTFGISFLSVAGIKQGTTAIVEARVELERMRNTLTQGVGAANVAGEIVFLKKSADQLGLSFQDISKSYASFAAAARGTAIEGQATRDVFLGISKASTVLGLSADQTSGALLAIQQMISKGTVQAEELRGQLGERLPGAFQIAARAMGVTTAELSKMLEQGQIMSEDFLPRFAAQLDSEFAGGLDAASKSAQASINRLDSAWTEMKQQFAQGAIGDRAIQGIQLLTDKIKDLSVEMDIGKRAGLTWGESIKRALEDVSAKLNKFTGGLSLTLDFGISKRLSEGLRSQFRESETRDTNASAVDHEMQAYSKGLQIITAKAKVADAELAKMQISLRTPSEKLNDTIAKIRDLGKQSNWSAKEVAKLVAAARAAAAPKGGAGKQKAIDKADLTSDLADIRREQSSLAAHYQNTESIIEASRAAGKISDREYYGERIRLIELTSGIQTRALEAENARRGTEKVDGAEKIRNLQTIKDNEAEIAAIRDKASTQILILGAQESAAAQKLAAGFEEARASAQAYLDTMNRGQQRNLESIGMGDSERRRQSGRSQIDDRYSQQRLQLESERRSGAFDAIPGEYDRQLALIEEFQNKALSSWDAYYEQLKAKQQDGTLGAREAIIDYIDASRNSFDQVKSASQNTFRSMEDAITGFATTGKLNFKSFADSIIADVARIAAQRLIGQLLQMAFGAAMTSGSSTNTTGTSLRALEGGSDAVYGSSAAMPAVSAAASSPTIVQNISFSSQGGNLDPDRIARMVGDVAVARVAEAQGRS